MRYLKRLILAVLIYLALYLPFIAVLQALTGTDLTAAFSVGGIVGAVELALGSVIKITENKEISKKGFIEHGQDEYNTDSGTGSEADLHADHDFSDPEDQGTSRGEGRGE
ncbi:hypothetical protein [Hominenteromicrobium sp.]|uniref:hypothetical protein n=1 Tax=Hominenteromicrobium sp. TaxID=3073581 RepID=UPI003AF03322